MKSAAKNIIHPSVPDIAARVDAVDWTQATSDLDAQGCAVLKNLLSPGECRALFMRGFVTQPIAGTKPWGLTFVIPKATKRS